MINVFKVSSRNINLTLTQLKQLKSRQSTFVINISAARLSRGFLEFISLVDLAKPVEKEEKKR